MVAYTNAQRQRRFRERYIYGDLFPPFGAEFRQCVMSHGSSVVCSQCGDVGVYWVDNHQVYCTCKVAHDFLSGIDVGRFDVVPFEDSLCEYPSWMDMNN